MPLSLKDFKGSLVGGVVARALADPAVAAEMLQDPRKVPPVQALQSRLYAANITLDDPERQHVGRWTAEVMSRFGFRPKPGRKGAERRPVKGPGPLSSGAIYVPVAAPVSTGGRWARAREAFAALPGPHDSVGAFLAARSAAWTGE